MCTCEAFGRRFVAIVDRRRRRRRYITQPRPEINYQELYIFLTMQRRPRLLARKRFILHTHMTMCVCVCCCTGVARARDSLRALESTRRLATTQNVRVSTMAAATEGSSIIIVSQCNTHTRNTDGTAMCASVCFGCGVLSFWFTYGRAACVYQPAYIFSGCKLFPRYSHSHTRTHDVI